MDVSKILSEIDAEIARLQHARSALVGLGTATTGTTTPAAATTTAATPARRRGRPKGSVNAPKVAAVATAKPAKRKRNLTPEGRKRIADAMKRRWAERRKEAAKNQSAKK